MNPEIPDLKEENLFSLAAEMGLVVISDDLYKEIEPKENNENPSTHKPYSQLT